MMADTTCKKKKKKKKNFLILTGVFCTVGGTLVFLSNEFCVHRMSWIKIVSNCKP
jgi:hypothetical protein